MAGLIRGESEAISQFLERVHHPVYCMAFRLAADPERRRDWTHETLLGILEDLRLGRFVFRRPGSFWAWFRKRSYFRLLDQYRLERRDRARELQPTGSREACGIENLPGGEDPVTELERTETLAALERCFEQIANPDHRRALGLLLFQELSYQEIAATMSVPLNTVRAWIRRGRYSLRRCLIEALALDKEPR